jgi:hypothetical protein
MLCHGLFVALLVDEKLEILLCQGLFVELVYQTKAWKYIFVMICLLVLFIYKPQREPLMLPWQVGFLFLHGCSDVGRPRPAPISACMHADLETGSRQLPRCRKLGRAAKAAKPARYDSPPKAKVRR